MEPAIQSYDFLNLLMHIQEGVYFVDAERRITFWNNAAAAITGFSADDVVGSSCADGILMHVDAAGNDLCRGQCPLAATMSDGKAREAEVYLHHKEGYRIPVLIRATLLRDGAGNPAGAAEIFSDNRPYHSMRLRMQELEQLAMIDELTQIPNRRAIEDALTRMLSEQERTRMHVGICMLDIDHFKRINDTHGHGAGDAVLRVIATTLHNALRSCDWIGRWGGEEFMVLLRNVDARLLTTVSERLRMLTAKSRTHVPSDRIQATVSIGATLTRPDDMAEDAVARADALLYQSKNAGRNRVTTDA